MTPNAHLPSPPTSHTRTPSHTSSHSYSSTTAPTLLSLSQHSRASSFAHSPSLVPPSPITPQHADSAPGGLGDLRSVLSALQELHPGAARMRGETRVGTRAGTAAHTPRTLSPVPTMPRVRFTPDEDDSDSSSASTDSAAELSTVWNGPVKDMYLSPSERESEDGSQHGEETSSGGTSSPVLNAFLPLPSLLEETPVTYGGRGGTPIATAQHSQLRQVWAEDQQGDRSDSLTPSSGDQGEALGDFSSVLAYLHSQTSHLRQLAHPSASFPSDLNVYAYPTSATSSHVPAPPYLFSLPSSAGSDSDSKRRALLDDLVRHAGVGVVMQGALAGNILDDIENEIDEVEIDLEMDGDTLMSGSEPHTAPPSYGSALTSTNRWSNLMGQTPKQPVKILLPTSITDPRPLPAPPLAAQHPVSFGSSRPRHAKEAIPALISLPSLAPPERLLKLCQKLIIEFPAERHGLEGVMRRTEGFTRRWSSQPVEAYGVDEEEGLGEVHVFIDHSNILVGFLEWLKLNPPPPSHRSHPSHPFHASHTQSAPSTPSGKPKHMLSYPSLALLLERGRPITKRVLVASSPLYSSLEPIEQCGYEVSVLQRVPQKARERVSQAASRAKGGSPASGNNKKDKFGPSPTPPKPTSIGGRRRVVSAKQAIQKTGADSSDTDLAPAQTSLRQSAITGTSQSTSTSSGSRPPRFKEQAVDELLQLHIYKSILSRPASIPSSRSNQKRNTLVIATGDAASSEFNEEGFVGCARAALRMGWQVEVVGWANGGVGKGWWKLLEELRSDARTISDRERAGQDEPWLKGGKDSGRDKRDLGEERLRVMGLEEWGWDLLE